MTHRSTFDPNTDVWNIYSLQYVSFKLRDYEHTDGQYSVVLKETVVEMMWIISQGGSIK